jgi:hypothetical protein
MHWRNSYEIGIELAIIDGQAHDWGNSRKILSFWDVRKGRWTDGWLCFFFLLLPTTTSQKKDGAAAALTQNRKKKHLKLAITTDRSDVRRSIDRLIVSYHLIESVISVSPELYNAHNVGCVTV